MTDQEKTTLVRLLLRNARDEAATFDSLKARPFKPVLAFAEVPDYGREF